MPNSFQQQQLLQQLDNILNKRFDLQDKEEDEDKEEEEELEDKREPSISSAILTREMITAPRPEPIVEEQKVEEEEQEAEDSKILTDYDEKAIDKTTIAYESKKPVSSISKNTVPEESMTLDQFIKNEAIKEVAYDFFAEMGEEGTASDMLYYFRKEISIDDMIRRMSQSKKWSDEQKTRYMFLKEQFNKTDWSDSSFQQKFKAVRQYGWQAMSDPSMIAAMLLAPFTGGGSVAARTGAAETGKFMIRQAIANTMKSGLTKQNVNTLARSFVSTPAKSTATISGAYTGTLNRLDQEVKIELGLQDNVNYSEWATHTGLGIVLGAGLAKGLEKLPVVTTPVKNAIAKVYANTDELIGGRLTDATEAIIQIPIDTGMARSFGTAVAEFKTMAKYSPTAKKILESINASGLRRIYQQATEKIPNTYLDDAFGWQGIFSTKLERILDPLKTGVRHRIKTRSEGTSVWSQLKGGWREIHRVDDETNVLLAEAMRGARIDKAFRDRIREAAKGGRGKVAIPIQDREVNKKACCKFNFLS